MISDHCLLTLHSSFINSDNRPRKVGTSKRMKERLLSPILHIICQFGEERRIHRKVFNLRIIIQTVSINGQDYRAQVNQEKLPLILHQKTSMNMTVILELSIKYIYWTKVELALIAKVIGLSKSKKRKYFFFHISLFKSWVKLNILTLMIQIPLYSKR